MEQPPYTEDEHVSQSIETLKNLGYEESTEGRFEEKIFNNYRKGPVNCSITYFENGDMVKASLTVTPRELQQSGSLEMLDLEEATHALKHLKNTQQVDYNDCQGEFSVEVKPQESPDETAHLLEETAEAVETVSDIRSALS